MSEDVETFRLRARDWLADNMPRLDPDTAPFSLAAVDEALVDRARHLQRLLFDAGFAGVIFPREYGGLGLKVEHQQALNAETRGYEMPLLFNVPTLAILAPTLLDFGTEDQKRNHVEAILRGDELWVQFLSEPTGGSDLAGAITRADRDGDTWVLNGAKTWSTFAMYSDWAMCLARTNWDVPKHSGLTMFLMKIHQPGIDIDWIKQSNGSRDFCEEFFSDLILPADSVLGDVDGGWSVASGLMNHERTAGGASPYAHGGAGGRSDRPDDTLVELVAQLEARDEADSHHFDLLGEIHTLKTVHRQLTGRVGTGMGSGHFPPAAGALLRMSNGLLNAARGTIAMELAGTGSVAWQRDEAAAEFGEDYLVRQAMCLGGGSTEMQRNIISERVLDMPRERAEDRDRPFRDVKRNRGGPTE
jgi:alkylation response protein AidB-like acyl-CoA dehydrogenase